MLGVTGVHLLFENGRKFRKTEVPFFQSLSLSFWEKNVFLLFSVHCDSVLNNAQLQVYHADFSFEICASSWHTCIFRATKIVDNLAHQQNQISKVWTVKLCLPNNILVRSGDWFKYHFWQLFFEADWLKIHFLLTLLFSLWIKTCRFYLAYMCEDVLSSKVW